MNVKIVFLLMVMLFSLLACKTEPLDPWDDINPMEKFSKSINNYHDQSIRKNGKDRSGNQAVYIDFSDGLVQAYNSETNKKVIDYISQKMVGSSIDWYGLGKKHNGVGKIEYANDRDIYNKVISRSSYIDVMAPIEEALKLISNMKNDAILITDFEEYTPDGREQNYAYAKDYFTSWVQSGNHMTIFYNKYREVNSRSGITGYKNLYFVIFTYGDLNENSLLTKFLKAIEGRGEELEGLKKFEINPNPFNVSNNYGGKNKTGLAPDELDLKELDLGNKSEVLINYYNEYNNRALPYEVFEFGLSINELFEYYFSQNRRFAKKLFLDASNNSAYILNDVKVEVTDITHDYVHFIHCQEAKNHIPSLVKDEGNNLVWNKHSNNNPIINECYQKNSQSLKQDCVYKYKGGSRIEEIFEIDNSIFNEHRKNSPKEIELITTFHNNFNGEFNSNSEVVLRLDFIVNSTEENYFDQLEDFKWKSIITPNKWNDSLFESIRNTLQTVKPTGILYSYYIKLEGSN